MALINRQQAQRKVPPRHYDKHFEELGGEIRFVEMMPDEWEHFDRNAPAYQTRLFIRGAHGLDEKGQVTRLFGDTDINKVVAQFPVHLINEGAMIMLELNGVLPASREGILKNSGTGPTPPVTGE
jgi:hypothetical protein